MIRHHRLFSALVLAGLMGFAGAASSAEVRIVNKDAPGAGLNDKSPAVPVGGNQGTTRGEQARIVFNFAANMWGAVLKSKVPVLVDASFKALLCDPGGEGVILGSTGTLGYATFDNDATLPAGAKPNVWYPGALANMYLGTDATPSKSDMTMSFNGALGTAACLPDSGWYFGLDGKTPEGKSNLLNVMLHEMGHGLGFAGRTNLRTGELAGGLIDIYSYNVYDNSNKKAWASLTDAQRAASAVKDGMLVMRGTNVVAEAPLALSRPPVVKASTPAGSVGEFEYAAAAFGPVPTSANFSGTPVIGLSGASTLGCEALTNGAAVKGHVAIIDRGTCGFEMKARNAQAAGATAVILANNVSGLITPAGDDEPDPTIPTVLVSNADGAKLKQNIPAGVSVTLGLGSGLAGTDAAGRVKIYAPTTLAPGSSFSHYDTRLTPNALMEYAESPDLKGHINLDLTPALFKDEGWGVHASGQLLLTCNTGVPTWVPGGVVIGANVLASAKMLAYSSPTLADYTTAVRNYAAGLASSGLVTAGQASSLNACLSNAQVKKQFDEWSAFAPIPLQNGSSMGLPEGEAGSSQAYKIVVPSGAIGLSLRTMGGTGDVSIYAKQGKLPTTSDYTYKSVHPRTNNESVMIARPTAGTYYFIVVGEKDFTGLTVLSTFTQR